MNERQAVIFKLIVTHILLPIGLTAAAFYIRKDLYLANFIAQTILLIVFLTGYWEFFGFRFRTCFTILIEISLIAQLIYRWSSAAQPGYDILLVSALLFIQLFLSIQVIKIIIVIYSKDPSAYEIQFPLKNGSFLITDGGNSKISRLMNYHFHSSIHQRNQTNNSMLFATDIIKLSDSKVSFLPGENIAYPIFSDFVYSPINGTVVKIENAIQDNQPFSGGYPYNTGNTVVIQQNDLFFLLGHLRQGSVIVHPGEQITANQLIAQVGNSGMSERPHIHMQLIRSKSVNFWQGMSMSLQYNGINLYKNRVIKQL